MSSGPGLTSPAQPPKDFFVSYTGGDRTWAEWIAFTLEEAGYTTVIQAWDSRPGMNFVAMMNDATKQTEQTIAVLSAAYLEAEFGFAEWAAAFWHDPTGSQRRLVPVRIEACDVQGLFGPIVYVDLVRLDEAQAKEQLLAGVKPGRAKPLSAGFPGSTSSPKSGALVLERPLFPPSLPPLWNIPYPRNPYFLGREEVLDQLTATLRTGQPTALSQPAKDVQLQAISGLGGIGKTHVALEYAYRYRSDYQAVLWAQADTRENLTSSFLALATLLDLPGKEASESAQVIAAVQRWLQMTSGYLLILDNADDLALAREFLPTKTSGHVLLTTRAQAAGRFAHRLEVDELPTEQGMLFLLRRAGLLVADAPLEQAKESDRVIAQRLCEELGGLPLALDQAGAYIEETGCGLSGYQQRYRERRTVLLGRRGTLATDHPEPVATTWSLSFEKVEQTNPMAADLLRLCAFFAPHAIPEELLTQALNMLHCSRMLEAWFTSERQKEPEMLSLNIEPWEIDEAVAVLRAYSLITRDPQSQTLTVHRLVQAVLRDMLPAEIQRQWMQHTVIAVNTVFPSTAFANWSTCERLLPHTLTCATWIKQTRLTMPEASRLLNQAGYYLYERARYKEAEPLYLQALAICEQQLRVTHPITATILNNLALLYQVQCRYGEAEPLCQRVLVICEQQLGPEHSRTAGSLNNLALLYSKLGRYGQAEPLYQRALTIYEQLLGATHPDMVVSLRNLAFIYQARGRYGEAESLLKRAFSICEQQLETSHPDTAGTLNALAFVYQAQGKYAEAEPLLKRALSIREQQLGDSHPDTAVSLSNLAALYQAQGRDSEAELLYQRTLMIDTNVYGTEHPEVANDLNHLATFYREQGRYGEAEPLYQRVLAICEQQLGPEHPDTADSLNNLALLYQDQGKYEEAEPLYQQALAIYEQQSGPQHTAGSLNNLAALYSAQSRDSEAEPLLKRALSICEQQLGREHPTTQTVCENYSFLLRTMGHGCNAEAK